MSVELPDPYETIDFLDRASVVHGTMNYNDETEQLYATRNDSDSTHPHEIVLTYAASLDPTKHYQISTRVYSDGYATVDYLVGPAGSVPFEPDLAGHIAPPQTASTTPAPFDATVTVGPGIQDWAQIGSGSSSNARIAIRVSQSSDLEYLTLASATITMLHDDTGGGGGDGGYNDAVAALGPALSWELDETGGTVVTDSSGNGYDGTYLGDVTFGVPSLIADGSGTAVKLGVGGDPSDGDIGASLAAEDAPPATTAGWTYQLSYTPPSIPPSHYIGNGTDVYDDTSVVLTRGFGTIVQFTHSGGPYLAYYGPGNTDLMIIQIGSNSGFAFLLAHLEPDVAHLLTITMDSTGLLSLYIDGELAPTYMDIAPNYTQGDPDTKQPYPSQVALDISGGFGQDQIVLGAGGRSGAGATYDSFHMWNRGLTDTEVADLYQSWSVSLEPVDSFGSARSAATASLERFDGTFTYSGDALADAAGSATADCAIYQAKYVDGKGSARAGVLVTAPKHTITAIRTGIEIEARVSGSYVQTPATMTMTILDDVQDRTPTALTVVLSGAIPGGMVQFFMGGTYLYQVRADATGTLSAVSIPIPGSPAGSYTLRAVSGSREASDGFTLRWGPVTLKDVSPDADPVEVPGALREDGSRAWVLQDLLPGGLGSYVMPRSPVEGSHPTSERKLTGRHSTAIDGQHHVWEALSNEYEWTFTGVTFTEDDQEKLYAYNYLNRRFYLMNHRNEAWVVSFTDVQIIPRLRKLTALAGEELELNDWLADYTVRVVTHDNTWRTPIPLEG